jgi:hypothetical protein
MPAKRGHATVRLQVVDHPRSAIGANVGFADALAVAAALDVFPKRFRVTHIVTARIADDAAADRSRALPY